MHQGRMGCISTSPASIRLNYSSQLFHTMQSVTAEMVTQPEALLLKKGPQ